VKPPILIYIRLKTLIDIGYKVLRPDFDPTNPVEEIARIFESENITQDVRSSIKILETNNKLELALELSHCNASSAFRSQGEAYWAFHMNIHFSNISCYSVTQTMETDYQLYSFFGFFHEKLVKITNLFKQSGILDLYITSYDYLYNLPVMRHNELKSYGDTIPKAFSITDWKILSIFIGCAGLLAITLLVYGAELIVFWKSNVLINIFQDFQNTVLNLKKPSIPGFVWKFKIGLIDMLGVTWRVTSYSAIYKFC